VDAHADPEIASTCERGARWLETARQALVDELARQLSLALLRRQPDRPALEAVITAGTAAGWPAEVLGFWIAALRLRGASWDDVGDLLGTSRQAAHHRFAPWARRYLPFVLPVISAGWPPPATPEEKRARLRESTGLGSENLDAMHQAIARTTRRALDAISESPPD
jgi:hypothetical protein